MSDDKKNGEEEKPTRFLNMLFEYKVLADLYRHEVDWSDIYKSTVMSFDETEREEAWNLHVSVRDFDGSEKPTIDEIVSMTERVKEMVGTVEGYEHIVAQADAVLRYTGIDFKSGDIGKSDLEGLTGSQIADVFLDRVSHFVRAYDTWLGAGAVTIIKETTDEGSIEGIIDLDTRLRTLYTSMSEGAHQDPVEVYELVRDSVEAFMPSMSGEVYGLGRKLVEDFALYAGQIPEVEIPTFATSAYTSEAYDEAHAMNAEHDAEAEQPSLWERARGRLSNAGSYIAGRFTAGGEAYSNHRTARAEAKEAAANRPFYDISDVTDRMKPPRGGNFAINALLAVGRAQRKLRGRDLTLQQMVDTYDVRGVDAHLAQIMTDRRLAEGKKAMQEAERSYLMSRLHVMN